MTDPPASYDSIKNVAFLAVVCVTAPFNNCHPLLLFISGLELLFRPSVLRVPRRTSSSLSRCRGKSGGGELHSVRSIIKKERDRPAAEEVRFSLCFPSLTGKWRWCPFSIFQSPTPSHPAPCPILGRRRRRARVSLLSHLSSIFLPNPDGCPRRRAAPPFADLASVPGVERAVKLGALFPIGIWDRFQPMNICIPNTFPGAFGI